MINLFDNLKPFTMVKLHTNNEWNELYGLVDKIFNNAAYIFCLQFPCYKYEIKKGYNENEFEIINND